MKRVFVALAALTMTFLPSCDVVRQLQGTAGMVNCKYDYRSVSDLSVAGVDLSRKVSLLDAPRLLGLLTGGAASVPIAMTVNLDVSNPNSSAALLNGMDYVLAIDGVDFTAGSVARPFEVAAGGTSVLPIAMAFDAATLLRGETASAALGLVRNILGIAGVGGGAGSPSRVSLRIRPSFNVAGAAIKSPVEIPVSFTIGK